MNAYSYVYGIFIRICLCIIVFFSCFIASFLHGPVCLFPPHSRVSKNRLCSAVEGDWKAGDTGKKVDFQLLAKTGEE